MLVSIFGVKAVDETYVNGCFKGVYTKVKTAAVKRCVLIKEVVEGLGKNPTGYHSNTPSAL